MLAGFATPAGTARYRDRFPQLKDAGHFRQTAHAPGVDELWLSSIGIGTYLGVSWHGRSATRAGKPESRGNPANGSACLGSNVQ